MIRIAIDSSAVPSICGILQELAQVIIRFGIWVQTLLLLLHLFLSVVLPYLLTICIFLTGVWIADREKYVHRFRDLDLMLFEQLVQHEASNSRLGDTTLKRAEIALRVSEDYRRTSVYLSFSAAYSFLASCVFIVCMVASDLFVWIFDTLSFAGLVLLSLSLISHMGRYWFLKSRSKKSWSVYMRLSWWLSDKFPPLFPPLAPSHLRRWREIGSTIQAIDQLRDYLLGLREYSDIQEVYSDWGQPQEEQYFGFGVTCDEKKSPVEEPADGSC